ncbi:MAG: hypothetical protein AUJ49_02600 [Desulfovibrionaceae bacterium CG1_02_65_16]|nr:MAG: hypothetical protein AUJ49_02600 [Desulfovibrionaceae bacterium CG1_02_65_16]
MREQEDLRLMYACAFAGEAGRVVLADLEARAFVRETSFHPDPQRAAFNEGRRSLALHVRLMLEPLAESGRENATGGAGATA